MVWIEGKVIGVVGGMEFVGEVMLGCSVIFGIIIVGDKEMGYIIGGKRDVIGGVWRIMKVDGIREVMKKRVLIRGSGEIKGLRDGGWRYCGGV